MSREIKQSPFEQYPHLAELMKEAKTCVLYSTKYWNLRCRYLEKSLDQTYGKQERDNCTTLYLTLLGREL